MIENILLTSRELSRLTKLPLTKARRNAKEFLPPDPQAGRRSGYSRKFNLNDAFKVVIGSHLVSILGYSFHDARTIINDIWLWAESVNLMPGKGTPSRGIDKEVLNYEVRILNDTQQGGFYYYIYGNVQLKVETVKDKIRKHARKITSKTYLYPLSKSEHIPDFDAHDRSPEYLSSKLLRFHRMLMVFLHDVSRDTWREWCKVRGLDTGRF